MNTHTESTPDFTAPSMNEGMAHVVSVDHGIAWLVPEQTGSCGACAASGSCGAKGIGTLASRLEYRRFKIDNDVNLMVGERVVIGIPDNALIKAAMTAYALPLATLLLAGALAQWQFGTDRATLAAMGAGLLVGLGFSHLSAGRLLLQGNLAPRFLRRARPGETCNES